MLGIKSLKRVLAAIAAIAADTGDASESTLGSLYAILGNPSTSLTSKINHIPKFTGDLWWVSTSGDDANDGKSPEKAFLTIVNAISEAAAGDRIYVKAGTYDEADLNLSKPGLELVCEQGTVLNHTVTPGTVLIVSGNYCRVVGAFLTQAGQTGIQITGNFCHIEDCVAFTCATGFDDDGAETHFHFCRSILHTTTGFDISAGYGLYDRCIAIGAAAVRGVYLSNVAADHNGFHECHTLGNTTAGWQVITGADNNLFTGCSMGAGDGARLDEGTNNTWNNFSEGSQIVAGQTRDQDLKDIYAAMATLAKQERVLCSVDFWSASQAEVALTGGPTSPTLPAVEVAEIPDGAEIVRVIAMFKFRMVENHTFDGTNALEGATSIQVKETDTGNFTNAITFVDAQFGLAKETREGGDIIIGAIDIAAEVDANDGYSFQWTNAEAEETGIKFNDVQMGLRVWYLL